MEQPERAFQRQDLFSAYKTSVLHDSPTLDEHYYHFAEDKDSARDRLDRNETQVITKYLSPGSKVGGKRQKPQKPQTILRVSQSWAWTIGDKWLITSTSCAKVDEKSTFVAEIQLSKVIAEYCIGACERKQELEKQISEPIRDDQSDPASAKTKIKDVRDELHILKTIAEYQQKVQASMENTIPSVSKAGFDENMKAKYVKNDVEELDRLASNIQEAVG
ncbi:hypothetical protein K4K61_002478 [Colletotrichum sp. SAR11_59]|nr:hypothetical protein K4K61_002478 [Colletotrichum sp. SAR11_59]